jgi:hypothetical protein
MLSGFVGAENANMIPAARTYVQVLWHKNTVLIEILYMCKLFLVGSRI